MKSQEICMSNLHSSFVIIDYIILSYNIYSILVSSHQIGILNVWFAASATDGIALGLICIFVQGEHATLHQEESGS